jgi:transposase
VVTNEEATLIKERNRILEQEVAHLKLLNEKLRYRLFGPQSEKVETSDEADQLLFDEIESEASKATDDEQQAQTELIASYERKKGRSKRKPFPENLECEVVEIDLPEAEKICPHDGTQLKEIGEDVTEKLKTYPARSVVVIEKKKKYACLCCDQHVAQAKANSILPKTIATPELLSFLIFSKFFQGLPLYRLEELYRLQGIVLSRTLMASWLIRVSEKLQPIWNILEEWALATGYMAIDATHVQVLKEPGRTAQSKSFMWARGCPELGIVLFDYDVSGGGEVAKNLMQGFSGALQADAHRGYGALERSHIHLLGCMMHARRRFHKAWLEAKKQPGLAAQGLSMFKKLYRFEEAYKLQNLTSEERFAAREKEVGPYLEKMKTWAESKRSKIMKSSTLGNALQYFINEYAELSAFLKDGRYEIDNGWIERAIRKFAIGRNNWIFCDSVSGAKASSLLYSFVVTAKLNNKDPFSVMTEIFRRLPDAETIDDYEKLAKLLVNST